MGSGENHFEEFASKMRNAGLSDAAIQAFAHGYNTLVAGHTGMIPERSIEPVTDMPRSGRIQTKADASLLAQAVVIKLNGGLGTSMGLERAKSLLPVKQ